MQPEILTAPQADLPAPHYDTWTRPDGEIAALFCRAPDGFFVRFPDQADFLIDSDGLTVRCLAVSEAMRPVAASLYHNAIVPLLGNYCGGLNLHGSAVLVDGGAIVFLGESRRGKTTLAGAFARAGFPFLTEDVVTLEQRDAAMWISPSRPVLRLFHDSASFLLDGPPGWQEEDGKTELASGTNLPFSNSSAPLLAIYLLGDGSSEEPTIAPLPPQTGLGELMRHSFVLDVNDRVRLKAHFLRLANLSSQVPVFTLDYPRRFEELPQIIAHLRAHAKELAST